MLLDLNGLNSYKQSAWGIFHVKSVWNPSFISNVSKPSYKLFKKTFLGWKNLNWFIRTRHDRHRRSELPIKLPSGKVKTAYHRWNSVQETQKPRNDSYLWFTSEPKIHKFMFWGEYYKYSLHINRLSIKEDKGDIVERSINSFNSSPFLEMTPRSNKIISRLVYYITWESQAVTEFTEPWRIWDQVSINLTSYQGHAVQQFSNEMT